MIKGRGGVPTAFFFERRPPVLTHTGTHIIIALYFHEKELYAFSGAFSRLPVWNGRRAR